MHAEARGSGGLGRKTVMKRASLMGFRAGLTFTSMAQQVRRHSGDAYVASQKLVSGACLSHLLPRSYVHIQQSHSSYCSSVRVVWFKIEPLNAVHFNSTAGPIKRGLMQCLKQ